MNEILEERNVSTKRRLGLYLLAESAILNGSQSYSIGNRTLTRADLKMIKDTIDSLQSEVIKLSRGNGIRTQRVVPRDGI